MLKHILMSALLLALPACANQDSPQGALPDLPGKVLIVGDSISLGFGAMGPNQNCPLTPEFNSVSHSYGVQVAEALGVQADVKLGAKVQKIIGIVGLQASSVPVELWVMDSFGHSLCSKWGRKDDANKAAKKIKDFDSLTKIEVKLPEVTYF